MTEKDLSNKIDQLVNQLKKDLLNVPYNSRGMWDRVKNWWQNLTKKPDNPANPYYLTNKFGSLGKVNPTIELPSETEEEPVEKTEEIPSEEEFKLGTSKSESRLTLKNYKILKESFDALDKKVNFAINENYSSDNLKNLEMFRIIDRWAVGFKKQIMQLLKGEVSNAAADAADNEKTKPETPVIKNDGGKILFKNWIRNMENVNFFIEIVNHIFSNPVRYRKPLLSVADVLKNKNVLSPRKAEKGTPLVVSIRNEILRMMKKEVDMGTKEEDSEFKSNVWAWAKNLKPLEKKNKEEDLPPGEAERADEPQSDFEESPPSEDGNSFLDI